MPKSKETHETPAACCGGPGTCQVVAIVSVDARGQMVLPKELRDQAGIAPGDKLAITTWEKDGRVVCLTLSKANDLTAKIEELLRPVLLGAGKAADHGERRQKNEEGRRER